MRYSKSVPNKYDVNRIFAPKKGDIYFTIDDLQFKTYAKWVYEQIKYNKKYIVISLYQGAHFAKYFVNTYSQNCLSLFILIDQLFTQKNYESTFKSQNNYDYIKSIVGTTR